MTQPRSDGLDTRRCGWGPCVEWVRKRVANSRTDSGSQTASACGRGRGSAVKIRGLMRTQYFEIRTTLAAARCMAYRLLLLLLFLRQAFKNCLPRCSGVARFLSKNNPLMTSYLDYFSASDPFSRFLALYKSVCTQCSEKVVHFVLNITLQLPGLFSYNFQ